MDWLRSQTFAEPQVEDRAGITRDAIDRVAVQAVCAVRRARRAGSVVEKVTGDATSAVRAITGFTVGDRDATRCETKVSHTKQPRRPDNALSHSELSIATM